MVPHMSRRKWIKHSYFKEVPTTQVCPFCLDFFTYNKTSRPRKYCEPCGRNYKLERMRVLNAEYRRLEKIRLGLA